MHGSAGSFFFIFFCACIVCVELNIPRDVLQQLECNATSCVQLALTKTDDDSVVHAWTEAVILGVDHP